MERLEETWEWFSEVIFGPSPAEQVRSARREVQRSLRRMQAERVSYENREHEALAKLRKLASASAPVHQMEQLAKEIARTRSASLRIHKLILTMDGININLTANETATTAVSAVQKATQALQACNVITSMKSAAEYQRELMRFEIAQEALDDMAEQEGEEETSSTLLAQICDEQNITIEALEKPPTGLHIEERIRRLQTQSP